MHASAWPFAEYMQHIMSWDAPSNIRRERPQSEKGNELVMLYIRVLQGLQMR